MDSELLPQIKVFTLCMSHFFQKSFPRMHQNGLMGAIGTVDLHGLERI